MSFIAYMLILKATFLFNYCQQDSISKISFWVNVIKQGSRMWWNPTISVLEVLCKWHPISINIYLPNYAFLHPTSKLVCSAKTHSRLGGQGKSSGKRSARGPNFKPTLNCTQDNRELYSKQLSAWEWHTERADGATALTLDLISLIFSLFPWS